MSSSPKAKQRRHATRTCLECRRRKVRCCLPRTDVPSDLHPLNREFACQRCRRLDLQCVVWDGSRKSARYTIHDVSRNRGTAKHKYSPASKPDPLPQASSSRSSVANFRDGDDRDSNQDMSADLLRPLLPAWPTQRDGSLADASELRTPSTNSSASQTPLTCEDSSASFSGHSRGISHQQDLQGTPKGTPKSSAIALYQSPLRLLDNLLVRSCSSIQEPTSFDGDYRTTLDGVLGTELVASLQSTYTAMLIFHPHLPSDLNSLTQSFRSRPTPSVALLLSTVLLCCLEGSSSSSHFSNTDARIRPVKRKKAEQVTDIGNPESAKRLLKSLQEIVRHIAPTTCFRMPFEIEAAQALELIAVHRPWCLDDSTHINNKQASISSSHSSPRGTSFIEIAQTITSYLRSSQRQYSCTPEAELYNGSNNTTMVLLCCSLRCWRLCLALHGDAHSTLDVSKHSRDIEELRCLGSDAFEGDIIAKVIGVQFLVTRIAVFDAAISLRSEVNAARFSAEDCKALQETCKARFDACLEAMQKAVESFALRVEEQCQQANTSLQGIASCSAVIESIEAWLDVEMAALTVISTSTILCECHFWRKRKSSPTSTRTEEAEILASVRILDNPDWASFCGLFGNRQFEQAQRVIAVSSRLFRGRHGDNCSASGTTQTVIWPNALLASYLVFAGKSLLDVQVSLLDGWQVVSQQTDVIVSTLHMAVAHLRQDNHDGNRSPASLSDVNPFGCKDGLWLASSLLLNMIASTMTRWQRLVRLKQVVPVVASANTPRAPERNHHGCCDGKSQTFTSPASFAGSVDHDSRGISNVSIAAAQMNQSSDTAVYPINPNSDIIPDTSLWIWNDETIASLFGDSFVSFS